MRRSTHALPLPPPALLCAALERPHPTRQRLERRHPLLQLLILRLQRLECSHLLSQLLVNCLHLLSQLLVICL